VKNPVPRWECLSCKYPCEEDQRIRRERFTGGSASYLNRDQEYASSSLSYPTCTTCKGTYWFAELGAGNYIPCPTCQGSTVPSQDFGAFGAFGETAWAGDMPIGGRRENTFSSQEVLDNSTTRNSKEPLSNENSGEKSRSGPPTIPIRSAAPPSCKPDVGEEEDPQGEKDEDAINPEVQRKEELRARLAKLNRNVGMQGMFGQEDQREQRFQLASLPSGLTQENRRTETGHAAVRVPDITADKTKESIGKEDVRKEYADAGVQVDIITDRTTGAPGRNMRGKNMQMRQFRFDITAEGSNATGHQKPDSRQESISHTKVVPIGDGPRPSAMSPEMVTEILGLISQVLDERDRRQDKRSTPG
jgi:hypothetical protein